MLKKTLILLFGLLVFQSCKLNPPTEPENLQFLGKVFVNSNVANAKIFVDDINTGKFTPDTITTTIDEHNIKLVKENYASKDTLVTVTADSIVKVEITMDQVFVNKIVLLEDFSNVSCPPCVASNIILENLSTQYGKNQLVKIKYPANYPSPNDPFYLSNPTACDTRMSDYNVFFTPTVIVDGIEKPIASDSTDIKNSINKRLNESSGFIIEATDSLTPSQYSVNIRIKTLDLTNYETKDLYLYTVVIEKYISFEEPPGSNGEKEFYDVMREMLPNANGFQLIDIASNSIYNYSYSVILKPEWNSSELTTVVFIQNKNNKEVYQAFSIN